MSNIANNLETTRDMKDSEIEWIGQIPREWKVVKLKSKYKFHTGFTPDSKNEDYYDDYGYIWITIGDLTNSKYISDSSKKISQIGLNNSKGILTPKGSLLYSFKLSVGQVAITDKECYTNEAIASFPIEKNPCIEFLYYSSQICIIENANENIYGAKLLNQELINNAWIIFPPIHEQQAIANYLDEQVLKIDELIVEQKQAIENWKAYKQSLITEKVTKGLNPSVEMKDSGIEWIGEIPKEWRLTKASILFNAEKGKNAQTYTKEYIGANPGFYPVYSGQTENDGIMGTINTFVYYKEVIFSTTVGAKAMTPKLISGKFSLSQNCMIANLRQDADIRFFYYQCIPLFSYYKNLISQYMQPSFTVEEFLSYRFIIPPIHEQHAIADFLDKKCSKIDQIIEQKQVFINQLEEYKQSLIYECVTGKRCVL